MTTDEAVDRYGFNPESIGHRFRSWGILTNEDIDIEEELAEARPGDLIVITRDNGIDKIDANALKKPNCRGTVTDSFDRTYRFYYFYPLVKGDPDEPA